VFGGKMLVEQFLGFPILVKQEARFVVGQTILVVVDAAGVLT
jgi:hypothetical protein